MNALDQICEGLQLAKRTFDELCRDYWDWWRELSMSTGPVDRSRAEHAICSIYANNGLVKAPDFVWFDSVFAMELSYEAIQSCRKPCGMWFARRNKAEMFVPNEKVAKQSIGIWNSDARHAISKDASVAGSFLAVLKRASAYFGRTPAEAFVDIRESLPSFSTVQGLEITAKSVAKAWFAVSVGEAPSKRRAEIRHFVEAARNCFAWRPFKRVVLMCERPKEIRHRDFRLHCDDGPALVWPDGSRVWALNGVIASQHIVETPAGQLSPKCALHTDDERLRAEIIRKIGPERFCAELDAKVIDRERNNELIAIDIGFPMVYKFVRAWDPGTGEMHVESVEWDCETVRETLCGASKWRTRIQERHRSPRR